jgi:hypothetical protein
VVRVQLTDKAEEIVRLAQERCWKVIVGVKPDAISPIFASACAPRQSRKSNRAYQELAATITVLAVAA